MNSLTYRPKLKKEIYDPSFVLDPRFEHQDRRNPESAPKFTADPRSTVFSKSANLLDLPQKSTIRALFKAKSVDPKTYSPPIYSNVLGALVQGLLQGRVRLGYSGIRIQLFQKKVALVIHDAWSMYHSPQCIMGASLVWNMPAKYKFTMRGPRWRRPRCLSFLLFIPCLKFPLTIRIYVSAPRAMKHGPCNTHHGSQEQPFLK